MLPQVIRRLATSAVPAGVRRSGNVTSAAAALPRFLHSSAGHQLMSDSKTTATSQPVDVSTSSGGSGSSSSSGGNVSSSGSSRRSVGRHRGRRSERDQLMDIGKEFERFRDNVNQMFHAFDRGMLGGGGMGIPSLLTAPFGMMNDMMSGRPLLGRGSDMEGEEEKALAEAEDMTPMFIPPRVDVQETKDHYLVTADVPGFQTQDLRVSLDGNILTITGEKKEEKKEEGKDSKWLRVERSQSNVRRQLILPHDGDPSNISASHDKGVLKVTIPKRAEVSGSKGEIPITAGESSATVRIGGASAGSTGSTGSSGSNGSSGSVKEEMEHSTRQA